MNSKLVSLVCCLIMLVSFSGCTKVTQLVKDNQPTKADLLAEINEEHRRLPAERLRAGHRQPAGRTG